MDNSAESYFSLSPYNYVSNNPIRSIDPDGNDLWDVVNGMARGATDNLLGTNTRANYTPTDASDYTSTLRSVDINSIGFGAALMIHGAGNIAAGGGGLATSAAIAVTGVGTTIAAPGAVGSAALMAVGAAELAVGSQLMSNATKNFGGQESTESQTSKEALGKAKEANGIPRSQQPDKTIKPGTPSGDKAGLDERNVRQYEYTNSKGQKVSIRQDKPASYDNSGQGDQGRHYNAGEKLKQHHYYKKQ